MNIASLEIDPIALSAIGFLGVVLVMAAGLFIWVVRQAGKPAGKR